MAEKKRVRCPVCGMMPFLEYLEGQPEDGTFEVEMFVLKFGGKIVMESQVGDGYTKKGRGSAKGYMELVPLNSPDDLETAVALFKKRAETFLGSIKGNK